MKYIGILLVLLAVTAYGGLIIQGYDGVVKPAGKMTLRCITVDDTGMCYEGDSVKVFIVRGENIAVTNFKMNRYSAVGGADSCCWYYEYTVPSDLDEYGAFLYGYGIDGHDEEMGLITFEVRHLYDYIATIYAQVDSTLFYLQDTSATAAEIASATEDTMSANANTYKADTSDLARATLLAIVQDSLNKTLDSVEAILDSLQLWDDNMAYLDASVNTRSSHNAAAVWSVGTRAITDKAGFALTTGERQAIADSVWGEATRALTDKANFTLSTAERQAIADSVWAEATRALTDKAGFALTAAERTAISDSVLTDSLKYRSDPSGQGMPQKAE